MIINERNIKIWSTIGPRATFGLAALEIIKKIENLIIMTSDVSTSAGLDRFRKIYKDNYIDIGIAEQNLIGIAAGLSSENFNVITTTFAPFQTIRCCEQIKVNLGYMQNKICMVGLASGLVLGNLGYTHCCIEDIGILRSIPNINIVSPSDSLETIKAIFAALNNDKSTYVRLTGGSNNPIVNKEDYKFEIGKSIKLKEGKDVTIFCSGACVFNALEAANLLEKEKIDVEVINMHTIKPVDKDSIKKSLERKLILTIEEHNIIGGLGSAVAEALSIYTKRPKHIFLGVNDQYSKGGSYEFLKEKHGLDIKSIINNVKKNLI
tara:strand:- start:119 stop:1081 length:963 start_codon:yes stop_codon:yes gene_type:complete